MPLCEQQPCDIGTSDQQDKAGAGEDERGGSPERHPELRREQSGIVGHDPEDERLAGRRVPLLAVLTAQPLGQPRHVRLDLLTGVARRGSGEDGVFPGGTVPDLVVALVIEAAGHAHRHPRCDPHVCQPSLEALWSHADDGEQLPVEANLAAQHVRTAAEIALPEIVAHNGDVLRLAWLHFVVSEDPAQRGPDTQNLEEVGRDQFNHHRLPVFAFAVTAPLLVSSP